MTEITLEKKYYSGEAVVKMLLENGMGIAGPRTTRALLKALAAIPTVDVVERKHGEWIEYNYPGAECVYCSKCKEEYYPDDLLLGRNDYPNFCPNCGADMRERGEDNANGI